MQNFKYWLAKDVLPYFRTRTFIVVFTKARDSSLPSGQAGWHLLHNMFLFVYLLRSGIGENVKFKPHTNMILTAVVYGCKTWSVPRKKVNGLMVSDASGND